MFRNTGNAASAVPLISLQVHYVGLVQSGQPVTRKSGQPHVGYVKLPQVGKVGQQVGGERGDRVSFQHELLEFCEVPEEKGLGVSLRF